MRQFRSNLEPIQGLDLYVKFDVSTISPHIQVVDKYSLEWTPKRRVFLVRLELCAQHVSIILG